ncbi:uncharacterized protein F4807DRAFT_218499 [Annulohypoxylon truncatum]|uniref:uncharacterized protein n=1 Tax=Annulohypoxylon truncatum TaxID=327061 RepID=UPI002008E810|nr:uncharacterized protein F4807DRAFT_218499 [Annulohypoxylon truncatum]KAI1206926.1 hypothetical protein F4807DRAFT_218499 [Annulohypoxylon truncatum]
MARKHGDLEKVWTVDEQHAQLLYHSLEQYNTEQKRTRRPSILLASLIFLFISSVAGLSLAVVLLLQPAEVQTACIARDLILFAASIGLVYVCIHIRGARKDYRRRGNLPPQIYGDYLHASALLIARFGIAVWVAALVATAVMIAKAAPSNGLAKMTPYLDLVICLGALPPFIAISATIESNPTPFATTGVSSKSFLSCQSSEVSDDLSADLSVSRRASLQRQESTSSSILTVPTAEIFKIGSSKPPKTPDPLMIRTKDLPNDRMELMANSPLGATYDISTAAVPSRGIPFLQKPAPSLSKSPPQPVYNPGGWRSEWNNIAEQINIQKIPTTTETPLHSSNAERRSAYISSSNYTASSSGSRSSSAPPKVHRASPSTSIASSAQRSRLSTVRYAAEPEIAVRQPIRVIKNPNYSPPSVADADDEGEGERGEEARLITVRPPEPVAVPRGSRQVYDVTAPPTLKRKPSNFSRPLQPSRGSEADSAIGMKISGVLEQGMERR